MKKPTRQEILEAIDRTKKPHLTLARLSLGITSPNRFYSLLREYGLDTGRNSITNRPDEKTKPDGADFLE